MKTPAVEYVTVLNTVYSICLSDELEQTDHDGECDNETKTILIASHLSEERMRRVMFHELIHAVLYESGGCEYIDYQAEEMLCQTLSGFFNGILNWTIKADISPELKQ